LLTTGGLNGAVGAVVVASEVGVVGAIAAGVVPVGVPCEGVVVTGEVVGVVAVVVWQSSGWN
jgi:hypothetical protein